MLKIGHRGAMGYVPENTLKSIQKAIDLRVDMVEIDVQVCKTGELVVIHDTRVDRTTNGTGKVSELAFDELRLLDAGDGEKIPTLVEVFELVKGKTQLNIELKSKGTAHSVYKEITKQVDKGKWNKEDVLISSFDHQELTIIKELDPSLKTGVLIYHLPVDLAQIAVDFNAYSLNVAFDFLTKELVDDAHSKGLNVFVYTVNEPEDIELCKTLGVDGIFSNYPDRI